MNPTFFIFISLLTVCSLSSCFNDASSSTTSSEALLKDSINIDLSQYKAVKHVVNPKELLAWQADTNQHVVLIDIRKKEAYDQGHLIGAHQVWRPAIRSTAYPFKGMMLEKDDLAQLLGSLGATAKSKLVLYDAKGNADAIRLWWMLAVYGHPEAYILNGGLLNMEEKHMTFLPTTAEPATFVFSSPERPELLATKDMVINAMEDNNILLLDCRTLDEFTGKIMQKDAFRAGHIPSAVRIEHSEAIAYERSSTFRDYEDLKKRFATLPKDKNIIVYCQSGVRSAHTTFILRELLGYTNVSNYDGSWIEWSYDENLPIETTES